MLKRLVKYGTRLLAWWIQLWWTDALLVAVIAVVLRLWLRPGTGLDVLGQLALADRRAAYVNMLQVAAIFAGFSGVGFAIYVGISSRGVQRVKGSAGAPLLRVWVAALVTPWACALILVFCGIMDKGGKESHSPVRWVAVAALAVVVLQLVRITWVFYQIAATDLEESVPATSVMAEPIRTVGR